MSNNSKNNIQPLERGKITYLDIEEEDPTNSNYKNNNIEDFQRNGFRKMGPMNNNFEKIMPNEGKKLYNPFDKQNDENKSSIFNHSIQLENPFLPKKTEENEDQLKKEEIKLSFFEKSKNQAEEEKVNIMNNNKVPSNLANPFSKILFFKFFLFFH